MTFGDKIDVWRRDLTHQQRADLLGVPLDTFRGWLYDKHAPSKFVQRQVENRMKETMVVPITPGVAT